MSIKPLPEDTARELGSTLAVTSPVAVVKELLDNALDSGASYVDIIISADALEKIEVRDNGHGISTDDIDSIGRLGHTSKIRTFDDVMTLGGKSLGFRGVALASINAVAELTLTTKTTTDPVATVFQLSPGGGVARKTLISAPVGTTVHVAKLFSRTPVREKLALRDFRKNLINIKELLQSYVLARPHVKLQFRVVRGVDIIRWSYSPKPGGCIKDAVIQIFGTELASSCAGQTFCVGQPEESSLTSEASQERPSNITRRQHDLVFEAYLPHSFADPVRVSKRAFFSVDSRPVLHTRGTLKNLYDTFRKHLSRSMSASGQTDLSRWPFIRLNIRCEPRSYDANIEPSKNDVLFHDESYIISKFEEFMLLVYPDTPKSPGATPEAALLTPSSTGHQQNKISSVTSGLCMSSQEARIASKPTTLRPRVAGVLYPSPTGGERLETTATTNGSRPPIQGPSVPMPGQPSPTAAMKHANTGFSNYLTSPDFCVMDSPLQAVDERVPSNVVPTIRRAGSEQSPSTRSAAIRNVPVDINRMPLVERETANPTGGSQIAPRGIVRSVEEGVDQRRCAPVQLYPRLDLDNVLPTPSAHTEGVPIRPNIQTRPSVLDMSACFVDSDDEEEMPRGRIPRLKPPHMARDIFPEPDGAERDDPLEGLNPWTIAKLTAPRRRPHQSFPQPMVEERQPEVMRLRERQPVPTARIQRQPPQQRPSYSTGSPRNPSFRVPGGAYKKPTMAEGPSRGRKEPMVQTTLSGFRAPRHPERAFLGAEDRPTSPRLRASKHTERAFVGTDDEPTNPIGQPTCSQAAASQPRLPKEDPRSNLLDGEQSVGNNAQRKLRRFKTDLLPLEKTPIGSETHHLRLTLNAKTQDLANLFQMGSGLDWYHGVREIERSLYENINPETLQGLIARATSLLRE